MGFEVVPKRWIVERTPSWIVRNRRMGKYYERRVQTGETFIQVATVRLMLGRPAGLAFTPSRGPQRNRPQ